MSGATIGAVAIPRPRVTRRPRGGPGGRVFGGVLTAIVIVAGVLVSGPQAPARELSAADPSGSTQSISAKAAADFAERRWIDAQVDWKAGVEAVERIVHAASLPVYASQAGAMLGADRVGGAQRAAQDLVAFPIDAPPESTPKSLMLESGPAASATFAEQRRLDALALQVEADRIAVKVAAVDDVWSALQSEAADPASTLAGVTRVDAAHKERIVAAAAAVAALADAYAEAAAPVWAEYFAAVSDARAIESARLAAEEAAARTSTSQSTSFMTRARESCLAVGGTWTVIPPTSGMCDGYDSSNPPWPGTPILLPVPSPPA